MVCNGYRNLMSNSKSILTHFTNLEKELEIPYILDNKVGLIFNSRDFWTRLFSSHAYFWKWRGNGVIFLTLLLKILLALNQAELDIMHLMKSANFGWIEVSRNLSLRNTFLGMLIFEPAIIIENIR